MDSVNISHLKTSRRGFGNWIDAAPANPCACTLNGILIKTATEEVASITNVTIMSVSKRKPLTLPFS